MSFDQADEDELRCDINVTPLVDVMLVLLVIFMVVTPMLRLGLPVELPVAKAAVETPSESAQVTLTAAVDGSLSLNGAPVLRDGLEDVLRSLYATRADRIIFLEADRTLPYSAVVDLIDICRAAGVERIGVVTQRPGEQSGR